MKFVELHSHSDFSSLRLVDSIATVSDLIWEAYNKGLSGVTITEHEAVCSHIKAQTIYKELKEKNPDADFKLLLGNEIYLCDTRDKGQKYYHFILIAKNKEGHKQLRQLSSRAWENSYYDRRLERVVTLKKDMEEILSDSSDNLIGLSACLGSELSQLILTYTNNPNQENKMPIHQFLTFCISQFTKENFYIEIQASASEDQKQYNQMAIKIAKAYGLKWVVTNDVHYINKEDRTIHAAFLSSKQEERELDDFYAYTYMKTVKEMRELLDYLSDEDFSEAINNSMVIRDSVEDYELTHPTIVPEIKILEAEVSHLFKDYYESYEFIKCFAYSSSIQDRFLLKQIEEGFTKKKEKFNEENIARIDIELKQVWRISEKLDQRLSAYYNLVKRCIDIIWEDSIVGVSRGSIAGYYFAFLIDIIQISPIKWNLPWFRHLEESRPELPKQHWAYIVNV